MEIIFIISSIILFLIAILLSFQTFKYFKTMWKFKNRKKDGSEDDDFKYFDWEIEENFYFSKILSNDALAKNLS